MTNVHTPALDDSVTGAFTESVNLLLLKIKSKQTRIMGVQAIDFVSGADPTGMDWVASHLPLWGTLSLILIRLFRYRSVRSATLFKILDPPLRLAAFKLCCPLTVFLSTLLRLSSSLNCHQFFLTIVLVLTSLKKWKTIKTD